LRFRLSFDTVPLAVQICSTERIHSFTNLIFYFSHFPFQHSVLDVGREFRLSFGTVPLAVSLLDRVLASSGAPQRAKLQLYASVWLVDWCTLCMPASLIRLFNYSFNEGSTAFYGFHKIRNAQYMITHSLASRSCAQTCSCMLAYG
jgi:hypothetical protein